MTDDKILGQLRALLEMTTERGCTESEAANAAILFERKLNEHNLTMRDVKGSEKSPVGMMWSNVGGETDECIDWLVYLNDAAAKLTNCRGLVFKDVKRFSFIGLETDAAAAEQLFVFFVESAQKALGKALDSAVIRKLTEAELVGSFHTFTVSTQFGHPSFMNVGSIPDTPEAKAQFSGPFLIGYASQICERVLRHLAARDAKESDTTAMIRHRTADVDAFLQENAPNAKQTPYESQAEPPKNMAEQNALYAGLRAAANVPIGTEKALGGSK